jgi:uracil-DNA glycosylase
MANMLYIIPKVDQSWSIIDIAEQACPPSWKEVFIASRQELEAISTTLEGKRFYPTKDKLFEAFFLTPLDRVRVVLIGQDPYHDVVNGKPRAMGLSFSSPKGANVPPSLRNVFAELKRSYPDFHVPSHGDLTPWAQQGVLLLNTSLTVEPGRPGSHQKVWMGLIINVLRAISAANPDCIYLLWGAQAMSLRRYIGRGTILTSGHPSSLNRNNDFVGNGHFVKVNELLDDPIDWRL